MVAKKSSSVADFFYSGEVAILSGLTEDMLDYLCRQGLITPSLSKERSYGKRRRFSFSDILLAKSIKALLTSGITVLSMRKSLRMLREQLHVEWTTALRDRRVVIVGGIPYFSEPNRAPIELLKNGQMAFSFVLEIKDVWRRSEIIWERRQATAARRLRAALQTRLRRIS